MEEDLRLLDSLPEKSPVGTFLLCSREKQMLSLRSQKRDVVEPHSLSLPSCPVPVLADPALALPDGSCCSSPYLV